MATKKSTKATRARSSRSRSRKLGVAIAAAALTGFAAVAIDLALGRRRIANLRDVPPLENASDAPLVSILVSALNEEQSVRAAMQSLLSLDYPHYEVVAVDDRSTDATGAILDSIVSDRLRVVHVRELPPGWLGKNHALQMAADAARGELLLFTDADVHFDPTTLSRAVRYLHTRGLDHLAAVPKIAAPAIPIKLAVHFFSFAFAVFTRPWLAADPNSKRHIGVGAFNLVRADAYRRAGGHRRIPLRPDDDLKLGKIVKESGGRQELVNGAPLLEVTWYPTVAEFVRGLEKNTFSAMEYHTALAVAAIAFTIVAHLGPYAAVLLTRGTERALWSAVIALQMTIMGGAAMESGDTPLLGLGYPFGAAVFIWTIAAATWKTLANDGIDWRGTHYPLDALRSNDV